jgi:hypothetical protein
VWLDPASADNLRDIRTYLHRVAQQPEMAWWLVVHQCSPDDFVQRLLDRSGGIWLYLSHLVAEIRGGHQGLSEPSRLPAGLANYFAEHAARWRGRDATKWDAVYAPVFATLAAAREPITLDQLMHWAGVKTSRHEIKRLLREAWRPVILEHEDPQRGTVYALYHHSLCEFAAGSVDRSRLSITGLYLMDDLQAQTREAHRRIVEYFRQQCDGDWSKLAGHAYVDRHLAHHLEKAQAPGTTPLRSRQQE